MPAMKWRISRKQGTLNLYVHEGHWEGNGPDLPAGARIYSLTRPRFGRDPHGWWLAPLIRIKCSVYPEDVDGMIEIPFITRHDGKLSIQLIDR